MKGLLKTKKNEMHGGDIPSQDVLAQMGLDSKESAQVEQYIVNGMKVIHSEKTRDHIVDGLKSGVHPAEALAMSLDNVLSVVDKSATNGGTANPPSDVVRFLAGYALLNQIAEVGATAGEPMDNDVVMEAFSLALGSQIDKGVQGGKYTPEELKQAGDKAAQQMGIDPMAGAQQMAQRMGGGM